MESYPARHLEIVAQELGLAVRAVAQTQRLLSEGATVPFLSRYRKEQTGGLDEVAISAVRDRLGQLDALAKRRATVLATIQGQGKLTDALAQRIQECYDPVALEDIYLPYKPKRRTRATVARERGLEPLAERILGQAERDVEGLAQRFISPDVPTVADALAGARDIMAEWVSEGERARSIARRHFARGAAIRSRVVKGKEQEGVKYADYFDWDEEVRRCASHRFLAMVRGQSEGILRVAIAPPPEPVVAELQGAYVKGKGASSDQVALAVADSYKRLIEPSMESEFTAALRARAHDEAIRVFASNLRQLLLSPPLGPKHVLAIDPGYRTGCKVVCLDAQGHLLHNETIYPHPPQNEAAKAMARVSSLVEAHGIEAIAIGNGTASRETEGLVKRIPFGRPVRVFVVSEDGASVYSASPVAREELPDHDVTVRGAVSIGRRLMDPLAELVKIDPKSIGVGQYQHDVDQGQLKESLDGVVESCVNHVGVNLNTASQHLLTYVSGLGPQLAKNIVEHRRAKGPFTSRSQLRAVPRLGDRAFEQCAGFLRIPNAPNPLDNTAVHPENYPLVERMAQDQGCSVSELVRNPSLRERVNVASYVTDTVGIPTLSDILAELARPGRDPRQGIKSFEFADGVRALHDLKPGMVMPGIVTNITNFGAFVDVGVKQDGLVHISQLASRYVSNPNDVVKLHQHVTVRVLEVDMARGRIQLAMKGVEQG